ncbi:MAG: glycosyltransferase family protein [Nannocystaceae bacterium]
MIHYYVHGRGQGHATRTAAIVEVLQEAGHEVRIFVGHDGQGTFGGHRLVVAIDSLPPGITAGLLPLVARRMGAAVAAMRRERPGVVISDGDGPGVWAAAATGTPCVAVAHGLSFSHCHPPDLAGITPALWRREGRKARWAAAGSRRQIAVNFAPLAARSATTLVARPRLGATLRARAKASHRIVHEDIVCYFRDDNGEAVLRRLVALGERVHLFSRARSPVANIRISPPDPESFADALYTAKAVVSSAGSQLISECLALAVPHYALYRGDDLEQRLNVAMLRGSGLGAGGALESTSTHDLRSFLEQRSRGGARLWCGRDVAEVMVEVVEQWV